MTLALKVCARPASPSGWIAIRLDARPRTDHHTFGLKRAQILAAVINAGALVAISLYLVANVLGTWLLHRGSQQNMNLKAAYLHLWEVAEHDIHFEGHVLLEDQPLRDAESIRVFIENPLHECFNINHTTLQIEPPDGLCVTAELA